MWLGLRVCALRERVRARVCLCLCLCPCPCPCPCLCLRALIGNEEQPNRSHQDEYVCFSRFNAQSRRIFFSRRAVFLWLRFASRSASSPNSVRVFGVVAHASGDGIVVWSCGVRVCGSGVGLRSLCGASDFNVGYSDLAWLLKLVLIVVQVPAPALDLNRVLQFRCAQKLDAVL